MSDNNLRNMTKDAAVSFFSKKQQALAVILAIPDLISVIDRNFNIVFSNWRGGHEYAAPKAENDNRRCYEAYYGLNEPCDPCHLLQVFETGKDFVTEKYNPNIGHLEIHAFPIFDESGDVVMAGEYQHDISHRKRIENALRSANQMLEALIEASPAAIIAIDLDGNLIIYNPAAERMFGWKKEEVIGKRYPLVHPVQLNEIKIIVSSCRSKKKLRSFATRRLHKDGHYVDVSLSTAPMLNSEGAIIGYMAIMEDISERWQAKKALKQSEESYRTIFDAANDATFVFNVKNGDMVDVNLMMCQMYGYTREEVLKLNVEELSAGYPPYTYQDVMQHIWSTRTDESHMFEWLAKDRSGRLFWVEVTMKGVVIGGAYRVLAVVRDITTRKIAEKENKIMQERLLQANKMAAVGTLASGIAHEINNPNNYILSNAQFLSGLWPDVNRILKRFAEENGELHLGRLRYEEAENLIPRMLNGITEGSHRIKGIVTGLKDFARQEKTRLDRPVDVNKVIDSALSMLGNKIKKHTDHFSCSLAHDLPPVKGSFRQLEQVMVNLTMNALEALPSRNHGVTITTSYMKISRLVTIRVEDEGDGMTEDVKKAIFDPFFTTKLDKGGTGLGLSIIFNIVKEHNGVIECNSKPGKGTVFYIRLPEIR